MKVIIQYTNGTLRLIELLETQYKLYWRYADESTVWRIEQYSKEDFYKFAKKEWGWMVIEEVLK